MPAGLASSEVSLTHTTARLPQWVNDLEKREAMEMGVAGADAADAVLITVCRSSIFSVVFISEIANHSSRMRADPIRSRHSTVGSARHLQAPPTDLMRLRTAVPRRAGHSYQRRSLNSSITAYSSSRLATSTSAPPLFHRGSSRKRVRIGHTLGGSSTCRSLASADPSSRGLFTQTAHHRVVDIQRSSDGSIWRIYGYPAPPILRRKPATNSVALLVRE